MAASRLDELIAQLQGIDAIRIGDILDDYSSLSELFKDFCVHASSTAEGDVAQREEWLTSFNAVCKQYFNSLPSSSTAEGPSTREIEARESILDVIWSLDQWAVDTAPEASPQAFESVSRPALGLLLRSLLHGDIVDVDLAKQRLEYPLLQAADLLTPEKAAAWGKSEPRIRTNLLYKQQKFNLLREESEGYSKLSLELASSMGPAHDARTALPIEPESVLRTRAERTITNIQSLIGYFDLDPTRALDVLLDAFQDNIVTHNAFFLQVLRLSPWCAGLPMHSEAGSESARTNIVPQIMGFKFSWYASSEGAADTPPEKLYVLAALLIKEGFFGIESLWPHLHPSTEDEMSNLKEDFAQSISDRIANLRSNALSMAGMLMEEMPLDGPAPYRQEPSATPSVSIMGAASGGKVEAAATDAKAKPANSRLGLLRALLAVGAYEPAMFILSTYPWICEAYPDVADLVVRLCMASLDDLYHRDIGSAYVAKADNMSVDVMTQAKARYSATDKRLKAAQPDISVLTIKAIDTPRTHNGAWRTPVYFLHNWASEVPICADIPAARSFLVQQLKLIGVHVGRNQRFLIHLIRLVGYGMAAAIKQEDAESRSVWESIIRSHLIPAISLSDPNPALIFDFWDLLSMLSYLTRFSMYGEWKDRSYKKMPELRVRRAEAERDAKGILKRLSIDNVKQFGRSLAKIGHTNPLVLFEIALNQVQSYDNLIGPVVESARYLTPFGYDALAYSLLDALSNPEKERTKSDGTNISLWLQGLATFAGTLCKRWNIDVSQILQYILTQLRNGNPKDLIVLRELISKMTGIEPVIDLSDSQILALGGGKTLQAEAINPTGVVERKGATKRSTARLKIAMQDSGLTLPLLVAVALQRQQCAFEDAEAPLKYLGNLFDQCQQVLFQFLDFINLHLTSEQYAQTIPDVRILWTQYGVDAGIAFHIVRPVLRTEIQSHDAHVQVERLREDAKASRQRAAAKALASAQAVIDAASQDSEMIAEPVEPDATQPPVSAAGEAGESVEAGEAALASEPSQAADTAPEDVKKRIVWHPKLLDCVTAAEEQLSPSMQAYMSAGFFVTFWQLSMYEIAVPLERYESEIARLNATIRDLDAASRAPLYPGQVVDRAAESDRRRARERCVAVIQSLNIDLQANTTALSNTRKRLAQEKAHWFKPGAGTSRVKELSLARKNAMQHFLQDCIVPRAKLSPVDASFSAKFIRLLHNIGTPNFPSLHVYDRIFSLELPAIVFHCTEGEARNYARFLEECLSDLAAWFADEAVYAKQAIGHSLPGFQRAWGLRQTGDGIPDADLLAYKDFRTISKKWHMNIATTASTCIESGDYMCIRNIITILTKISKHFPFFADHGITLEGVVTNLVAAEKREDLKVLAVGYSALLKKASSQWIDATTMTRAANVAQASQSQAASPAPERKPVPSRAASPAPTVSALPPSTAAALARAVQNITNSQNSTPQLRPAGLPQRPGMESGRSDGPVSARAIAAHAAESRKPVEAANGVPTAPRASHALPIKPSPQRDSEPRGGPPLSRTTSSNLVATASSQDTTFASPSRFDKADRPASTSGVHAASRTDTFAKPLDPGRSTQVNERSTRGPDSPRDDRRDRRHDDPVEPRRTSRAGSVDSGRSSNRDRSRRTTSRRDADDRTATQRQDDRSRQRELLPPPRDEGRLRPPPARDVPRDGDRSSRHSGNDERRTSGETNRSRDAQPHNSGSSDPQRERPHERERDVRSSRDVAHRDDRRSVNTGHRDLPTSGGADRANLGTSSRSVSDSRPRHGENGDSMVAQPTRDRKRSADAGTAVTVDARTTAAREDDHEHKRRRTEDGIPSGPRAHRPSTESLRPANGSTSIKGRASGQGMRIKSAGPAVDALASADKHNARVAAQSPRSARDGGRDPGQNSGREEQPRSARTEVPSRGLADRLAPPRTPNSDSDARDDGRGGRRGGSRRK